MAAMVNSAKNQVANFIKSECRRRAAYLWGQKHFVTPRLVEWVHGDGLQVIYFTPLATRPEYYVVRIDSHVNLSNSACDGACFAEHVLDDLYDHIEEQFGSSYEEWTHENGRTYKRHNHWPALNDSCGSAWGMLFKPITTHKR